MSRDDAGGIATGKSMNARASEGIRCVTLRTKQVGVCRRAEAQIHHTVVNLAKDNIGTTTADALNKIEKLCSKNVFREN